MKATELRKLPKTTKDKPKARLIAVQKLLFDAMDEEVVMDPGSQKMERIIRTIGRAKELINTWGDDAWDSSSPKGFEETLREFQNALDN